MAIGSWLWFLAIGGFVYFMMKSGGGCCGAHAGHHDDHGTEQGGTGDHAGHHGMHGMHQPAEAGKAQTSVWQDPVCGMTVDNASGSLSSEHLGHSFHFCSAQCRKLFELDPDKYAKSVQA